MTATRIALLAGVAALAGCTSNDTSDTARVGGITLGTFRIFDANAAAIKIDSRGSANAVAGQQANLVVTDATPAAGTTAAVPGEATLNFAGEAAPITAEQVGERTLAVGSAGNRTSASLSERLFGTAAAGSTTAAPMLDQTKDRLTVIDAQYARIAYGTAENVTVQQATGLDLSGFAVGPKAADGPRAVPTAGTATYVGNAYVNAIRSGGADFREGDVEMRADFGTGAIVGEITFAGTTDEILMRNGTITDVDYNGDVSLVQGGSTFAPGNRATPRGTFRGGFYGPNAEETNGLIDYQGTVTSGGTTGPVDVTGAYIATKR